MGEVAAPELAALGAKLAAADAGQAAPPGVAMAPAAVTGPGALAVDESREWIDAAMFYGDAARELLADDVRKHWTDERLRKFGEALARCAQRYGWKWGGAAKHPLAMLAAAGWPLAWPIAAPYVMPHIAARLKGPAPASSPETAREDPRSGDPVSVMDTAAAATAAPGEAAGRLVKVPPL